MQVYENAIGNINAPNYTFWQPKDNIDDPSSHTVILAIWFIWFLNQWFIFMILLNFVIALISQSYETVMTKAMEAKYAQRTKLNKECQLVMKSYGAHHRNRNIFLMTATHEDHDTDPDFRCVGEWYTENG